MHRMLNLHEKEDIIKFVSENNVKIINLCHIPEDGRLKTLSFAATNKNKIRDILSFGERVDGSSLLSFIESGKSDIYIKPNIDKAFIHPFAELPTLNILCDYLDEGGKPLAVAPTNVLARAEKKLFSASSISMKALAELEFYIISGQEKEMLFPSLPDRNYHESAPFAQFENLRNEVLATLDSLEIPTKYCHSEVGRIQCENGVFMEQHEVEFAPENLAEMAETVAIAKWIIRNVCAKHGVSVSFSPKPALEHAGNGMHIHLAGLRKGKNITKTPSGTLSVEARRMIGGLLKFAPSLAAFGNPRPVSYLRFIARKESPMHICWSARNRLALIRIPLWWDFARSQKKNDVYMETFEYRASDALANVPLLFAGMVTAVNYAVERPADALKIAEKSHVEGSRIENENLKMLPRSCNEAAENLKRDRSLYEEGGVFPKRLIDKTIEGLKAYKDRNLWKDLEGKSGKIKKILEEYLHCG
jgi:glutamine synthetase